MTAEPSAAGLARPERRRSSALDWCLARRYALAVWAGMLAWSAVLFTTVRSDYIDFRLGRFDFGNMIQAVWSTAHGRPLEVTTIAGDEASRLSFHVDPVLALLAPAWLVAPTPLSFVLVRVIAVALGALPVFWLARRHLGSEQGACLLALAYLAYPWLSWAGLSPHSVALSIPLLLFAVWFLDNDRLLAFAPFGLLALLTNEVTGLTVVALGIWYALARGRRIAGFAIAGGSLAWVLFAVYVIVPSFSGASSPYYGYFLGVGGSPQGVVRTVFTDPGAIVAALAGGRDVLYLLALGVPLLGLFFLAPALAAVAIPQLLLNGLAGPRAMTDPTAHYTSAAIPLLVAATIVGVGRLRESRRTGAAAAVLVACVGVSLVVGVTPGAPSTARQWDALDFSAAHVEALREAVALVPPDAAVSASDKAGSHLSARRYFYSVPVVGRATWIVLDTEDPFVTDADFPVLLARPGTVRSFARRIEQDPSWVRVFDRAGVLVFERNTRDHA